MGFARRPRAPQGAEALHGSPRGDARDRDEHPCRSAARARGGRCGPQAEAPSARRVDRVRTDGVRTGTRGAAVRARALGRPDPAAPGRGRLLPRLGTERVSRAARPAGRARVDRDVRRACCRRRLHGAARGQLHPRRDRRGREPGPRLQHRPGDVLRPGLRPARSSRCARRRHRHHRERQAGRSQALLLGLQLDAAPAHQRLMELETERLLLRKPDLGDLDAYVVMYSDPETVRFLSGTSLPAEEVPKRIERLLEAWDEHGLGLFSVVRKDDARVVGRVGHILWDTERWFNERYERVEGDVELEVAWTIVREFWGHGYATEAALACRDHAFGDLGRERIISLISAENTASLRVAEKIGESLEQRDIGGEAFRVPVDLYSLGNRPAR